MRCASTPAGELGELTQLTPGDAITPSFIKERKNKSKKRQGEQTAHLGIFQPVGLRYPHAS